MPISVIMCREPVLLVPGLHYGLLEIQLSGYEDIFCWSDAATWHLLTSLPIATASDVQRVTRFYALRWRVERFDYTLKSGALQVEKLQFDDIQTLINS